MPGRPSPFTLAAVSDGWCTAWRCLQETALASPDEGLLCSPGTQQQPE